MGYYDDTDNVDEYIRQAAGYDGRHLIEALKAVLPAGSTLLELGMGPGKDLLLLEEHYQASGSDRSAVFLRRFRRLHPHIGVMALDAVTIDTDQRYDGIYSNKALIHLSRDELRASFRRQAKVIKAGGIALHAFWHGDGEADFHGLRFVYYREDTLKPLLGSDFEVLDCKRYTEIEAEDSLYVLLRRR